MSKKIFRFFWFIWWVLFGAAIGTYWGYEGGMLAAFGIGTLIVADLAMYNIQTYINYLRNK